jgi:hypothetical protein
MNSVIFNTSGIVYDKNNFYQYDYGQYLEIQGLKLPETVQIHFARKGEIAENELGHTINGVTTVKVPDSILKYAGEFVVYIYVQTETSGKTLRTITFHVNERAKPLDYDTEVSTMASQEPDNQELLERIQKLEDEINILKSSSNN